MLKCPPLVSEAPTLHAEPEPRPSWNCFYWGERGRPAMVRLVFCPQMQPKLRASTCHLPGLVEHAKLSQRVEAGVEPPGPGVME